MTDEQEILKTFEEYSEKFQALKPRDVMGYYHYPSILINDDKAAALKNPLEAYIALKIAMGDLKKQGYEYAYTRNLKVTMQSDHLAIITGAATRFRKDDSVILDFGLTYNFRKDKDNKWKIIAGIIHDIIPPSQSYLAPSIASNSR